jgi:hypothetical protein
MGANMARRLIRKGHTCVVFNRSPQAVNELIKEKAIGATSLAQVVKRLEKPRAIWLMVPAAVVDDNIADPHSYCLVITRGNARIVSLAGGSKIERDALAYLKAIKAKQPAKEEVRALFNGLLQPIREVAENENLVLVRDQQRDFSGKTLRSQIAGPEQKLARHQ